MRIAVLDLLFNWPPDGGARTDLKELLVRLHRDHHVTLLVADCPRHFPRGRNAACLGLPVEHIPAAPWQFTADEFARRLRAVLDRLQPELLFFADGWYMKPAILARLQHFPYVLRFYAYEGLCLRLHFFRHGQTCPRDYLAGHPDDWWQCTQCALGWIARHRSRPFFFEYLGSGAWLPGYRTTVRTALAHARAIICYNEFIRQRLLPYSRRVHLLPSGICPDNFVFHHAARRSNGHQRILMVGRTADETKGFAVLLAAFRLLRMRYPHLQLIATSETGSAHPEPGVTLLPWQTQEQLPALYADADICVVPSVWEEPFGIVALEAMASGVPLVVTDVGGLQDIVSHRHDGLICRRGDPQALAAALTELIEQPEFADTLRRHARATAQCYTWDTVYRKFSAILTDAAASAPAAAAPVS